MQPLWRIILISALTTFAGRWKCLFRALLLPACVLTYLTLIEPKEPFYVRILYTTAQSLVLVTFLVTTHRIILLDLDLPPWVALYWSKRETRFFFWSFLLGFLLAAPLLVSFLATDLVISSAVWPPLAWGVLVLAEIFVLTLFARLSLILPAIAIDARSDLASTWKLSHEHVADVFLVLALPQLAFLGFWFLVFGHTTGMQIATIQVLSGLAYSATTAFEITLLSVCYQELVSRAAA